MNLELYGDDTANAIAVTSKASPFRFNNVLCDCFGLNSKANSDEWRFQIGIRFGMFFKNK